MVWQRRRGRISAGAGMPIAPPVAAPAKRLHGRASVFPDMGSVAKPARSCATLLAYFFGALCGLGMPSATAPIATREAMPGTALPPLPCASREAAPSGPDLPARAPNRRQSAICPVGALFLCVFRFVLQRPHGWRCFTSS